MESLTRELYCGSQLWIVVVLVVDCDTTSRAGATTAVGPRHDLFGSKVVDLDVRFEPL